jgi:hypothetical protein
MFVWRGAANGVNAKPRVNAPLIHFPNAPPRSASHACQHFARKRAPRILFTEAEQLLPRRLGRRETLAIEFPDLRCSSTTLTMPPRFVAKSILRSEHLIALPQIRRDDFHSGEFFEIACYRYLGRDSSRLFLFCPPAASSAGVVDGNDLY